VTLIDRGALAGHAYYYRVTATAADGRVLVSPVLAVASRAPGPQSVQLSVAPIPSRGATRVDFSVPREEHVRLSVLDAQGRLVAVLADGLHAAGAYHVAWDGRRGAASAPAGLYFVRLELPGEKSVRRLVLVH
jgi:hypothetical protein